MGLGTIVYDNEIYNLDYITSTEVKEIITAVESNKMKHINAGKKID